MNCATWSAASVFANSLLSESGSSPAAPITSRPGCVHGCRPPLVCVRSTFVHAPSKTAQAANAAKNLRMQNLGLHQCGRDRVVEGVRAVAHQIVARQPRLRSRALDVR